MRLYTFQNSVTTTGITLFILFSPAFIFAQVPDVPIPAQEDNRGIISKIVDGSPSRDLTSLQQNARKYRLEGLKEQNMGNLDAAMTLYQKAINIDPSYAVAYNDLGVIFEAKGFLDRAEECYQKAINIDPDYLSAYSNLALFYENKGQVDKAIMYWKKRADLGVAGDPWTAKAKNRYNELMRITPAFKQNLIQQEIEELNKVVMERKRIKKQETLAEAKKHLKLAKSLYSKSEYRKAQEELRLALLSNPQEQEALSMLEMTKLKIAEQEKREKEERKKNAIRDMKWHFESGVKYYQADNLQAAKEELGKVKELIASPQKQ